MKIIKEQLKFRTAVYPQLSRLPKGVRLIIQDGYKTVDSIDKYASFSPSGKIILIGAGNSKREARKNSLLELNRKLREENLIWGNKCPHENYIQAIY